MQVGPYRVSGEIARGGHGVVYRAEGPQGPVALKLLHAHRLTNPRALKRFQLEIQALARLRHPHVVPVHAATASAAASGRPQRTAF